jgi:quinol monooxygenase YgiN
MFVQFIRAKITDVDGLRAHLERGGAELTPGVVGFLGSTAGVSTHGDFVVLARYDSEAACTASRTRPESEAWWRDLGKYIDGEPVVKESGRVSVLISGSDAAGFVQIMEGTGDPAALAGLDERFLEIAPTYRPEIMGGYRAYFDDGTWADITYFTNETAARAGESREMPSEVARLFEEFGRVAGIIAYHDLTEPLTV